MPTKLVLVRHGKARNAAEGQQDIDRELSEVGRRSLSASLPRELAPLLPCNGPVQVWTSPAARAVQTAELLVSALDDANVKVRGGLRECRALWDQDAPAFLEQMSQEAAPTVFAVGHNPFMETLAHQATGAQLPFATGAMAAIELDWDSRGALTGLPEGRLLWFSQGPVSQRWKTVLQLERALQDGMRNVDERLALFLGDPDDVETMHRFRVGVRTLRSLVAFVRPWQENGQNASVQEDLKAIVAETSRLRELDVLADQAAASTAGSPDLVAFCRAEAAHERSRVMKALSGKRTAKRMERIAGDLQHVRWKRRLREEGLEAAEVRDRFREACADLERDLSALDLSQVEKTHDVRKGAKRVRYVAEGLRDVLGQDAPQVAKGMTAHQDDLGAICDARVNIDLINGYAERDVPEPIAWDLALLRAENETFLYTTLRGAASRGHQ